MLPLSRSYIKVPAFKKIICFWDDFSTPGHLSLGPASASIRVLIWRYFNMFREQQQKHFHLLLPSRREEVQWHNGKPCVTLPTAKEQNSTWCCLWSLHKAVLLRCWRWNTCMGTSLAASCKNNHQTRCLEVVDTFPVCDPYSLLGFNMKFQGFAWGAHKPRVCPLIPFSLPPLWVTTAIWWPAVL